MLPPGHIAAGYLTAYAVLKVAQPDFTLPQINLLIWLGLFFGFAPDLDTFVSFKKKGSFTLEDLNKKTNHRFFVSHAPLPWLIAGLAIYFFADSEFVKYVGLMVWLGSWSHFVFDSLQYGIMWLWPLNRRLYALRDVGLEAEVIGGGFFKYWINFLRYYMTKAKFTFYTEVIVILIALRTFFSSWRS